MVCSYAKPELRGGMSNRFALHTATLRNAQLAGIGEVTGSIAPGKSADFIVTRAKTRWRICGPCSIWSWWSAAAAP